MKSNSTHQQELVFKGYQSGSLVPDLFSLANSSKSACTMNPVLLSGLLKDGQGLSPLCIFSIRPTFWEVKSEKGRRYYRSATGTLSSATGR